MTTETRASVRLFPLAACIVAALVCATGAFAQTEYLEPGKSGVLVFGQGTDQQNDYANNGVHGAGIAFSSRGKFDFGASLAVPEGEHADPIFFLGGRYFAARRGDDMPFDIGLTLGMSMREHYIGPHFGCTFHRCMPLSDSVTIVPGFVVEVANLFALEENWSDETEAAMAIQAGLRFKLGSNISLIVEPGYILAEEDALTIGAGILIGTGSLFKGNMESGPSLLQ